MKPHRILLTVAAVLLALPHAGCDKPAAKHLHPGADPTEPAVQKVNEAPPAVVAAPAPASPTAKAPAPAAPPEGQVYGAGVSAAPVASIDEIKADPDKWVGKRVRVEGVVTDVCAKRGCWFKMAGDKPGEEMRFKVKDGVMVFPMSARGQYAGAEGLVRKIPLDLEQTRRVMAHEAEEQGNEFDPATVTEPITLVRLDGAGAVLRDKK